MTTSLAESGITRIEVRDAFLEKVNEKVFKCRECGSQYKSAKGTTNLVAHASTHLGLLDKIRSDEHFHRMTNLEAINMYNWMKQL